MPRHGRVGWRERICTGPDRYRKHHSRGNRALPRKRLREPCVLNDHCRARIYLREFGAWSCLTTNGTVARHHAAVQAPSPHFLRLKITSPPDRPAVESPSSHDCGNSHADYRDAFGEPRDTLTCVARNPVPDCSGTLQTKGAQRNDGRSELRESCLPASFSGRCARSSVCITRCTRAGPSRRGAGYYA